MEEGRAKRQSEGKRTERWWEREKDGKGVQVVVRREQG